MLQEPWKTILYWSNSDKLSPSFQKSCVIETGLSDFHKMVTTVMEATLRKIEPKLIKYRDSKFFCNDTFREFLQNVFSQNLKSNCDDRYNNFAISCKNVLDKIVPWKKKCVRGNHSPFGNIHKIRTLQGGRGSRQKRTIVFLWRHSIV